MADRHQLPGEFIDGYWAVVVKELRDGGMSESAARTAVAGYRQYMTPAGNTIYNDPTAESARMARQWLDRQALQKKPHATTSAAAG